MSEFLLIFLLLAFSAPVAFVVFNAGAALMDEARDGGTPCAPSRRANITASVPQERRRMLSERTLGPPAGWHEPAHVAIVPAPATAPTPPAAAPQRTRRAVPVVVPMAAPEVAPVAVPDWPTRQTVEQPAQVAVNRTAARFGSLEINRD